MKKNGSAHTTTGIRRILEYPAIYEALQKATRLPDTFQRCIQKYIRPNSDSKVLDIGCGTAEILSAYPDGVEYVGYDLNRKYIEAAKLRFGARGQFFCAHVGSENIAELVKKVGKFDFVVSTGLLHHLHDSEVLSMLETAWIALKPEGVLVTLDPVWLPHQRWIPKLIIGLDRGQNTRSPEGYLKLASQRFGKIECGVINDLSRIPYDHFYIRATK